MRSFVTFSLRGIIAAAILSICSFSYAAMVNYQGILTNATGDSLLHGTYNLTFSLFPSETGGTANWTETHTDVEVDQGFYSVTLGSVTALPDTLGEGNWLEIEVNDTPLDPRLEILSDFRAIEALHADNADSVNHIPASETPTPGHLVPLGSDGVFPSAVIPFRADSVLAGEGLTATVSRQNRSLDERVGLNVGAGDGIEVTADAVSATLGEDIQTDEIEDGAVETAKIDDDAVTTMKIDDDAVTTPKLANDAVTTAKIDDDAVTTPKLANDAVTTAKIDDDAVTTVKIANNAVTTAKIAAGAVTNTELANDAVTSVKVANNTLTTLDIFPDIVSSVDGVANDGGDIDLIAGANITITPNNAANSITISAAAAGGLQGGECIDIDSTTSPPSVDLELDFLSNSNCIDVDYDPIDCEVTFDFDFAAEGDNCIDVDWDADNCELTVQSMLTLIEGTCIDIDEDAADCDYTISVDMECFEDMIDSVIISIFDTLEIPRDSVYDSEVYARSFVVTPDGTIENARGHLTSDGKLELYGDGGDTVRVNPDGTMEIIQDGELVGGFDENGEFFARSFMVINAQGDTVGHLTSTGDLEINGDILMGDDDADGHDFFGDGTWSAWQSGVRVAGLDEDGEIFARSFYVLNAQGDTVAHIRSDGWIEGAGVIVTEGGQTVQIQPGNVTVGDGSNTTIHTPGSVSVTSSVGGITIAGNGTWSATQNDQNVAGLDSNGELYAKSFYVKDPVSGDTLIHLTSDGNIELEEGAQVTVGGVPIEGGGSSIDSVFDSEVYAKSFVVTPDGTLENATAHVTSSGEFEGTRVAVSGSNSGVYIQDNGTWYAVQSGQIVAGLDNHGEIHAKSFYIQSGTDTLVHITNDGYVIVQGDTLTPGSGGEQDSVFDSEVYAKSFVVTETGELADATAHLRSDGTLVINNGTDSTEVAGDHVTIRHGGTSPSILDMDGSAVTVASSDLQNGVRLNADGTWTATQNDEDVAGLDENGEIHARSFFVINSSGDTLAHLMNDGSLIIGNNNSGWTFNPDGTMNGLMDGQEYVSLGPDGYMRLISALFIGEATHFYPELGGVGFYGGSLNVWEGNLTVGGKVNAELVDPIICEVFKTKSNFSYVPGTVIVMDPNSDAFVPCFDADQTSVVGVVTPNAEVDENGNISVVILGAQAPPLPNKDGRLQVRVKVDASYGAIKRGDLLTTSATEGHAMLAAEPKLGTIIGKALESIDSGKGEIKVMVTLN